MGALHLLSLPPAATPAWRQVAAPFRLLLIGARPLWLGLSSRRSTRYGAVRLNSPQGNQMASTGRAKKEKKGCRCASSGRTAQVERRAAQPAGELAVPGVAAWPALPRAGTVLHL